MEELGLLDELELLEKLESLDEENCPPPLLTHEERRATKDKVKIAAFFIFSFFKPNYQERCGYS